MGKDENLDPQSPYDERVGGGRVADKDKGTVYSPRQIDEMKEKSDRGRERDEK